MTALRWTFASRRAWLVAGGLLFVYGVVYLLVAKALVVDPGAQLLPAGQLVHIVPGRLSLNWLDPAFVLYLTGAVVLAPSVPAVLTVAALGALVGANGAMAVEALLRRPAQCDPGTGPWWIVPVLPSFLASFSCCAPTILLLLGGAAAGAVVSLIPFIVPVAALLLLGSLVLSARSLSRTSALA